MIATTQSNLHTYLPILNSTNSKQACRLVKQINCSNKVLLGVTQGIGNVIMATPLIKALVSLNLDVHILEGGFNGEAEKVLHDMPGVKILHEDFAPDHKYLLGLQTVWPRIGVEKYCAQVRSAGNILKAWEQGIFAHEVDMNMSLAYSLQYEGEVPSLYCKNVNVNGLPGISKGSKSVGIHICRKYNHQFYANRGLKDPLRLGEKLLEAGYRVAIFGHKDCVTLEDKQKYTDFSICDGWELPETAGAIKNVDCMINEDSGIMHVTAAMDTPQVALFGPTSDIKNRPWSTKAVVVKQKIPCQPCQYTPKQNECTRNVCMDISHAFIARQVELLIDKFPKEKSHEKAT